MCVWGWLLRVPAQGFSHHFRCDSNLNSTGFARFTMSSLNPPRTFRYRKKMEGFLNLLSVFFGGWGNFHDISRISIQLISFFFFRIPPFFRYQRNVLSNITKTAEVPSFWSHEGDKFLSPQKNEYIHRKPCTVKGPFSVCKWNVTPKKTCFVTPVVIGRV